KVRRREFWLVPIIEGIKTLLDPIFWAGGIVKEVMEITLLDSGLRSGRLGHIRVFLPISGGIALLFRGEDHLRLRVTFGQKCRHHIPAVQCTKLHSRQGKAAA